MAVRICCNAIGKTAACAFAVKASGDMRLSRMFCTSKRMSSVTLGSLSGMPAMSVVAVADGDVESKADGNDVSGAEDSASDAAVGESAALSLMLDSALTLQPLQVNASASSALIVEILVCLVHEIDFIEFLLMLYSP